MSVITNYEIEHHFELKHLLSKDKQIMHDVKIVSCKEEGEVIVEDDLDNRGNISMTFGGLTVSLNKELFLGEVRRFIV